MRYRARIEATQSLEFDVDDEMLAKYGEEAVKEAATEAFDLDLANFDVTDIETA